MDRLDVLNTKLIDLINARVRFKSKETGRNRSGKIFRVDEYGASVMRKDNVVSLVPWEDLEWEK